MMRIILGVALLLSVHLLQAQVTWDGGAGTNNWSDADNWNPNGVPAAGQTVTIGNGFTVVLNINTTVAGLVVGGGASGQLTLGNNNTDRTLTVTGNITVNAGATLITAGNGGNIVNLGGNLVNNGIFNLRSGGATANLVCNGSANQTISGTGTTTNINLLTVNNSSPASIIDIAPSGLTAAPAFATVTSGILRMSGTYPFSNTFFSSPNYTIGANAGLWINNPNVTVTSQSGDAVLSGLIRITSGTYNIGNGADWWLVYNTGARLVIEGGSMVISGALVPNTSGASGLSYTQSGGTLLLCTSGNNFSVGTFDMAAAASSFNMSGGSIIFQRPSSVVSDYINYAGTSSVTGGTIQFGNANTPGGSLFQLETSVPFFDLTVNPANNPTLQYATNINIQRHLTIGGVLNADAFDQSISLAGNWTNNGSFIAGGSTAIFNSTSQPQVIGGTATTTFNNLTNSNTASTGVSLAQDVAINGSLNLSSATNGRFRLGNQILTMNPGATITGANTNRYVVTEPTTVTGGRLRQNNLASGTARLFPIGTLANYLPVSVTPNASGSDFSISSFSGTTTNGIPGGPAFSSRVSQVNVVWRVDRAAGSASANLNFNWASNPALEGANFATLANPSIGIWRNLGSGWLLVPTPTVFVSDNTSNFSSTSGTPVSSFGTAGTGHAYIVANIAVLPSALRLFAAQRTTTGNRVQWELEDAAAYKEMELQQSADGIRFVPLLAHQPIARQNQYDYLHPGAHTSSVYYRLRLKDFQGSISYSHVVAVGTPNLQQVRILQNPAVGNVLLKHPQAKSAAYSIADLNGRVLQTGAISNNAVLTVINTSNLPAGMYVLKYSDDAYHESVRFINQ